jgi:hypothetical protein
MDNGQTFEVVDVLNKPVAAPKAPPEAPAKPQNYLLDLQRHGTTTTQGYESEEKRDQYFHYYDQRGYQVRARNVVSKPPAAETDAE